MTATAAHLWAQLVTWLNRAAGFLAAHHPGMPTWAVVFFLIVLAWIAGSYAGSPIKWFTIAAAVYVGWRLIGG